jgi:DNA end-binding protein Ku
MPPYPARLIQAKVAGHETTRPATEGGKADVVDLMTALQASLDEAKKTHSPAPPRKAAAKGRPKREKRSSETPTTRRSRQ